MSRSFTERNPVAIAIGGLIALALVLVGAYYAEDLPLIGGGDSYTAYFTDAAGLKPTDDVRIAGVKVGQVDSVGLAHHHVLVGFTVKDAWVGDRSTAAVKIKTLLGQDYIAIDPQGDRSQNPDTTIPLTRTTTPLSVSDALNGLASTVGNLDTSRLAQSFRVLSAAFANTPASVRSAFTGLSALSRTLATRDAGLRTLADNTAKLSTSLATSNSEFAHLINDGAKLLAELQARSAAITALLRSARSFAEQVDGLVRDNRAALHPALTQLSRVSAVLDRNQANLDEALRLIGPYYSLLTDATGTGPWLDVYLCGLFNPRYAPQLTATARRNCTPRVAK